VKLAAATDTLQDAILDATWPVWHDGLTREAYGRSNLAQQRTEWGRQHLQRVALVDGQGHWFASAKTYRFDGRVGGRTGRWAGLGALFTPPPLRGRGHARALVEEWLEREAREGALLACLFSEIGTTFYERLGFVEVPLDEVTLDVRQRPGAPAMLVRAGDEQDLPALAAMHDTRSANAPFVLHRPVPLIRQAIARRRLLAGLTPGGRRQVEFVVAEEGASAVAYVVLTTNAHGWTLQEAGDRDPAGARLGAILQALLAREPSRDPPAIRAWWPGGFPIPPQVSVAARTRPRTALMVRPLAGEVRLPDTAADVFYWHGDRF
jgi:GNAT superfamily N-acetyltransferase